MGKELTPKQERFCEEYLIDLNATQAAIRAGYSASTACKLGYKNMQNAKILEYIQQLKVERSKRTEITQDMVLNEIASIAFSKATDYLEIKDGELIVKDTDGLNDEQISAIHEIKEGKFGIEIKFYDKQKALDQLGKHLGMWSEKDNTEDSLSKLDKVLEQLGGNI